MADPYAGLSSASATMANVRGSEPSKGTQDDAARRPSMARVVRGLLPYLGGHRHLLALGLALSAVSVLAQLYVPILVGRAVDALAMAGDAGEGLLISLVLRLAGVVAVAALAQWVSTVFVNRIANETVRRLRVAAFAKLRGLPLSYIDTHPHGDLLARITSDVDQVGEGLLQGLTQLFSGVFTILGTFAFMCSISVPVALVVALLTPLSIGVATLIARRSQSSFSAQQRYQGELSGFASEMLTNQRLVTAFSYGPRAREAFSRLNQELLGVGQHAQFVSSLTNPSTRLVNNITYAVVAIVGCSCVIAGVPSALTVGQMLSFLSYANQYMKPFNEVSSLSTQVQTAIASALRVMELLDEPEEAGDGEAVGAGHDAASDASDRAAPIGWREGAGLAESARGMAPAAPAAAGALDFQGVSFSYVPDRPLLQDVSFSADPGQRIALVGPTGCGKTTLINLLLRFYEVEAGTIRVDGIEASAMSREELRSRFGMVLQDTWLFTGTVRDNIAFGKPEATGDEIMIAAMSARAHKFILQLPQGYDTVIGEGGAALSAGQSQLVCIARAMLADAPILLLDEATSSIDTRTELQVQAAFDEIMKGRTSLVVAHRLSTVRDADCILVMDAGRILERGTHDELLAANGFYARLYRSQFASA